MRCGCQNAHIRARHYSPPQGPLTAARTSLREACKQLALLELHLAVPEARCADCITKHLLCAEAFADEAAQLEPRSETAQIGRELGERLAQLSGWWSQDVEAAAEEVRVLRKAIQPFCV